MFQTASKPGYALSPLTEKKGDFQALKLGRIDIQVRRGPNARARDAKEATIGDMIS